MTRRTLPQRRFAETLTFEHPEGSSFIRYTGSIGRFDDGAVAEIFLNSEKLGSTSDTNARDAAVAVSLAFQYGCPLDVMRKALARNRDGSPAGAIAHLLDLATKEPS